MPVKRVQVGVSWCAALLLVAWTIAAGAGCRSSVRHGDSDLPNFQQVNGVLYRGGQPSPAGFERLKQMGVKTIVNVRGDDVEGEQLKNLGFNYEHRPMSAWKAQDDDVVWFLQVVADSTRAPLFLHCQHGADRTGYLIAMYRIVVEDWERERAIAEMTADGNGFHPLCGNLIRYIRAADVEMLRARLVEERHDLQAKAATNPSRTY